MEVNRAGFPSCETLWRGVVLGTIAHAIWVTPSPIWHASQGWDGVNYLLKDGSGDCGAVTFTSGHVVAVFFDLHSPRSPLRDVPQLPFGQSYRPEDYFIGAPSAIQEIAHAETLLYVFDDYQGQLQPVITAACWSEGATLAAREPWADVLAHGGHLIETQTLTPDAAIPAWAEDYEFSGDQVTFLRALFARKMASLDQQITVEEDEYRLLAAGGDAGMADARELLAAVGIRLP